MIDDFSYALIMFLSISGWCVASYWRVKYWHLHDSLSIKEDIKK